MEFKEIHTQIYSHSHPSGSLMVSTTLYKHRSLNAVTEVSKATALVFLTSIGREEHPRWRAWALL